MGRLVIGKNADSQIVGGAFALGHAILAIFLQILAVLGGFFWYTIAPVFAAVVVLSLTRVPVRQFALKTRDFIPETPVGQCLSVAVVLLLLMFGMAAFSQPGADAIAYYIAQPKLTAATGAFKLLPAFESFGVIPAIAEMPYAVMFVFGGDAVGLIAAKFSMWPVLVGILLSLWRCAKGLGVSVEAAWLFMGLVLTSTAVTLVAWDGKTDLIGLMYLIAAVLWMPGAIHSLSPSRRHCALFGFMAACAVLAKFSYALILPFTLGLPLLLLWWRTPKVLLQILLVSGLAVFAAFALGWWGKNALLFGDPFSPLLQFNKATPKFTLDQVWFNAEYTRWIMATYPLAVTFGKYPMQHGGISPLWLMLLPALWMRPWQSESGRKALYLALGSLAGMCAWVLLRPSVIAPRYFLPALILPCLILVMGYQLWVERKLELALAAMVAALLLLVMHVQSTKVASHYASMPLLDAVNGDAPASPLYALAQRLDADTRPNAKVLLLSYATGALPSRMLATFEVGKAINKGENIFEFALRTKVDYIVYSPHTHKRADIDSGPPPGLTVQKITVLPDVYYLYVLTRQPDGQ